MTDQEIFDKASNDLLAEMRDIMTGEHPCPVCNKMAATALYGFSMAGVYCADHGLQNRIQLKE